MMPFDHKELLERVIAGVSLTESDAGLWMTEVMQGKLLASQISAMLIAMRMKGETVEEITGLARVMRQFARHLESSHPWVVDTCGTGGDGGKTFNVSTIAAFVVAGAGIPVAKHGNVAISSKCGSADLLKALGIHIEAPLDVMQKALDEIGICFMFAPLFHPAMMYAAPVRREIGVRTVFNILGPLTNPALAKGQVVGVFRRELVHTLAEVLKKSELRRAFVVHGRDGLDEATLTGETSISELQNGEVRDYEVQPEDFGFSRVKLADLSGGDVNFNKRLAIGILSGEKGPPRDMVLLNAGFAIAAGSLECTVGEGIQRAREAIDSLRAMDKLKLLIKLTQPSS